MAVCEAQLLDSFLEQYDWISKRDREDRWLTGWEGEDRSYPLAIQLSDTWISFQVSPFLKLGLDWESWPEISHFLLELNHLSHMAKLSIDSQGDIHLSLEVFTSSIDYDKFCDTLGVLAYYADFFYNEILNKMDHVGFRYSEALNFLA